MAPSAPSTVTPPLFLLPRGSSIPHRHPPAIRRYHSATNTALLHQPPLPSAKKHGGGESNNRPLTPKHPHSMSIIQNAGYLQNSPLCAPRVPFHLHRPLGRLLPHPHPPPLPEIPYLCPRGTAVQLPSHALRAELGSPDLFKDHCGGSQEAPQRSGLRLSLHRRLAPLAHLPNLPGPKHAPHNIPPIPPRLHYKLEQIPASTYQLHRLPRGRLEWSKLHAPPQPPQLRQDHRSSHSPPVLTNNQESGLPVLSGGDQLLSPLLRTGSSPPQKDDTGCPKIQGQNQPPSTTLSPSGDPMVEPPTPPLPASPGSPSPPVSHVLGGRVKFRMGGSLLPRSLHLGQVVLGRTSPAHQRAGVQGNTAHPVSPRPPSGSINTCQVRQLSDSLPNKETGLQQKQEPQQMLPGAQLPLPISQLEPPGSPHPRIPECLGRLPVQGPHSPRRMVSNPKMLSPSPSTAENGGGSVRAPRKQKASSFRVPVSPPAGSHHGRDIGRLEQVDLHLPLSSDRADTNLPIQTANVQRTRHPHRALPARRSVVATLNDPLRAIRRRARGLPARARHTTLGSRRDISRLSRVHFLKAIFGQKYPKQVATALTQATRASTNSQYEYCWKDFQSWLSQHEDLPLAKETILQYLLELGSNRALSPKTILVYRNALRLPLLHGFGINTSDEEFSMLAKSQFHSNPPPQRVIPTWKPNKVLSMFEQPQFATSSCTVGNLHLKTLFLIALASGSRVSEIAAMSRGAIAFAVDNSQVVIPVRPGFIYKNQSLYRTPPNIVIPALLNDDGSHHRLCPVLALQRWLRLSSTWGSDAVFLNPKSKRPMNRGAISHYLVKIVNRAIPNTFARAHDLRKISASLAWVRGVSPFDITRVLFWKNTNTFINKYLVPLRDSRSLSCVAGRSTMQQH